MKEERVLLLEAWRDAEAKAGASGKVDLVEAKLPRKVKMRRMAPAENENSEVVWEEYYDYSFPDDEKAIGTVCCCCMYYDI